MQGFKKLPSVLKLTDKVYAISAKTSLAYEEVNEFGRLASDFAGVAHGTKIKSARGQRLPVYKEHVVVAVY